MTRFSCTLVAMILAAVAAASYAQTDSGQQPSGNDPHQSNQSSAAPPAYGQSTAAAQVAVNPPISGLDLAPLGPTAGSRSFLIPGIEVSESLDTNVSGETGNARINGVTRVLGSLALQRLWSRYDLDLNYVGGGAFYSNRNITASQLHQLDSDQRILWRTGQLAIRDSFSYLPEGSFGYGSYGGASIGGGLGGIPGGGLGGIPIGLFGGGTLGSLGQAPRITNTAVVDVVEMLSPRSSVTVAGSYSLVHFTNNDLGFINSNQVTAQAGYNYQLNRKDQLALVYAFQSFKYPSGIGIDINSNIWHVLYGHRISGRMDLVLGGGPQLTHTHNSLLQVDSDRISMTGRASLRYQFPRTSVALTYSHYNTNGSGFFAGANSDIARFSFSHPLGRKWTWIGDVGYTHNNRLATSTLGVQARTYNYWYAGSALRRQFGRNFGGFVSYQYNNLGFDDSFCTPGLPCSRTSQRHVAVFGIDWHPNPIRLD